MTCQSCIPWKCFVCIFVETETIFCHVHIMLIHNLAWILTPQWHTKKALLADSNHESARGTPHILQVTLSGVTQHISSICVTPTPTPTLVSTCTCCITCCTLSSCVRPQSNIVCVKFTLKHKERRFGCVCEYEGNYIDSTQIYISSVYPAQDSVGPPTENNVVDRPVGMMAA